MECPSSEGWGPLSPTRPTDFTPCFEYGAVVVGLNAMFLVAAGMRLRSLKGARRLPERLVAGAMLWSKLAVGTAALVASVVELALAWRAYPHVSAFTVAIGVQTAAAAAAIWLHAREQLHGRVASTALLLFWLGTVVVGLVRLRTAVATGTQAGAVWAAVAYTVAGLAALTLECQAKPAELFDEIEGSPEEQANIFSRVTFSWMTPLLEKGYAKPLEMDDTWVLGQKYRAEAATTAFQRHWQAELRSGKPSLFRATVRTYWRAWALGSLYKLIKDLVAFLNPILLSRLIGFVERYNTPEAEPIENGYFYAGAMFVVASVQTLTFQQHWAQNQQVNSLMKTSYTTAIYSKTLALSNDARQQYNIGGIVTHMSVDAQRVADFTANFSHHLWSSPLQIILALVLLHGTLGWASLAGVAAMTISIPAAAALTRRMRGLNKQLMGYRDQRMKIMDEILSGIKIIKLYAWEFAFIKRVNSVRERLELATIRRYGRVQAVFSFVTTLLPVVVSFATFGLYSLFDNESHGPLTPQLVFVALTLFNMLRFPLTFGPMVVPALLESIVSNARIEGYLTADEIDFTAVGREPYDRQAPDSTPDDVLVDVRDASFKWLSTDEPTLKNVSLQCRRQELVAVVGRVGAGKSSLVSAILGDMIKSSGTVAVRGSVAYVPQQAWIVNATLRENILFGNPLDQELYERVVWACALTHDLEMLPAGDMTEIGEKGINLSGGQKARVSLARAVYARADVYILDDPLAAVDAHVGKHIFTHVLGPAGILKTRARILVTNAVQYLGTVSNIVMLEGGEVAEHGALGPAMARQGAIFDFVHRFVDKDQGSQATSTAASDTEEEADKGRRSSMTLQGTDRPQEPAKPPAQTPSADTGNGKTMSTEASRQGSVEWKTYMTYYHACGARNAALFFVTLLAAATSAVAANMWLKHWAASAREAQSPLFFLLIYGALGLLGAAMSALQALLLWTRCAVAASLSTHRAMLRSVLRAPMAFFDVTPLGRVLNRFSSDMQRCDEMLPRAVSSMVNTIVSVASAVVVIGLSTPPVLALLLPLSFVYRSLQQRYLASSRELRRLDSTTRSPIFAHFQESIAGVASIRAYAQQPRFIFDNHDRIERNIRAYFTYLSLNRWLSLRLESLGNTVMLATSLLAVVSLHYFGVADAGLVGLAVTYALDFTSSLNWSVRSYTEVENSMVQLERVAEYAQLPSEAPELIEDNTPQDVWPEQGLVEFKNYSTRYRDGLPLVLNNLSFRVEPRQKVGIVGRTGAGKSSLTLALFRIVEAAEGQILLDGEDISQYGLFDVRSRLSIIPQDPVLFAGTVRENLDPFSKYTDQEIWNALEHAHLAEFIRTKADRLEFEVTQGGENLSVGQRQLICLARALLKRAKILVLDEATAAIDNSTDAIIQESIRREFQDCTVLTIAHRLNTIIDNDKILVIDAGRVAEFDTPKNLLSNESSLFSRLVEEAKASSNSSSSSSGHVSQ
ncbi:hypothetical protein GGF46_002010 [Coemansia sp. RSA 552]|nr:hypothetical protein GGF46_002010 [Coemansia sp. RSA 552]